MMSRSTSKVQRSPKISSQRLTGHRDRILADRLAMLVEHGLLTTAEDPSHKQKITYGLTEKAIELVPVLTQLSAWGIRHRPVGAEYAARMVSQWFCSVQVSGSRCPQIR
jgi:DNA-binding HxlR family transcriptional regulator